MNNAGQAIAQQVVHSQFFQQAKTVGIYLHCTKLREVDTTPIVSAAVEAGKHLPLPEKGGGGWKERGEGGQGSGDLRERRS